MVACPGAWKSFDELEETLSLAELNQILESYRKMERERQKFAAALKGVDLDKNSGGGNTDFDAVKKRAQARIAGIDEETLDLAQAGIKIEEWED